MKIRTDFVTNSSSSSFVLEISIELAGGNQIFFHGVGSCGEGSSSDFGDLNVRVSPRQLGMAKSVQDLVELLKTGVEDSDAVFGKEAYIFDEKDPIRAEMENRAKENRSLLQTSLDNALTFIHRVEHISDMDTIKRITITGDEHNYRNFFRTFSYDREKDIYTRTVQGCEFDKDGGSGGDLIFSDASLAVDPKELMSIEFSPDPSFLNFRNRKFATTGFTDSQNQKLKKMICERGGSITQSAGANAYCLIVNKDYGRATEKYLDAVRNNKEYGPEHQTLILSYEQFLPYTALPDGAPIKEGTPPYRIEAGTLCDVSAQVTFLDLRDEKIQHIAQEAFSSCEKLTQLDLPIALSWKNSLAHCPLERVSFGEADSSFKKTYFGDRPIPKVVDMPLIHLKECAYAEAKPVLVSIYLRMQERGDELCKYYKQEYDTYLKSQRKKFYNDKTALVYMAQNRLIPAKEIPELASKSRAAGDLALAELLENAI